jgi:class 3 adenylate cyclase
MAHYKELKNVSVQRSFVGPRTTYATVLFADMRGYTGLAEQLAPARVVPLLKEFFAVLTSATAAFGGRAFHMAGDGMMAGFGINDPNRDGAREAIDAGSAMLHRFAVVATRWRGEHSITVGIGIGLHVGEIAMGRLGPPGRKTMIPVGDTANVASLLCSRARAGEMLFSCSVAKAIIADGGLLSATIGLLPEHLPLSVAPGRTASLDFWRVLAMKSQTLAEMPQTVHREFGVSEYLI